MKFTTIAIAAGFAALASAQSGLTYNDTTGVFSCAVANGSYCGGANIIIRCTNGVGQPGNCDDNLDGYPPVGLNYSPCWNCTANNGRAACSKNGTVYPGSGSGLGTVPFSVNDTSICAVGAAPYLNSTSSAAATTPLGTAPAVTTTTYACNPAHSYGTASTCISGTAGLLTFVPVSATGGSSAANATASASTSILAAAYTGGASVEQMLGAGVVVGFGAVFAAVGMM